MKTINEVKCHLVPLLLVTLLCGCNSRNQSPLSTTPTPAPGDHGEPGGHDHQEPELANTTVTQWGEATELFLEYPALIAGQATGNWAIHLTRRADFKPITEGSLTVRFVGGEGDEKEFLIPAPARPGIFLLDPVLAQAGTYEVVLELSGPLVASSHTLHAVKIYPDLAAAPLAEEEESGGIIFLKEQQWVIDFAVVEAVQEELAPTISVPGEIVPVDGALVEVAAPVSGLALAEVNRRAPSIGQWVKAGQTLAVLSPIAEVNFARARAQVERLERETTRLERLAAAGAIPTRRLEDARRDLEVARAELAPWHGEADEQASRYLVRAPIDGAVAARSFVPGGRVEAGERLFTIVDPRRVWLRAKLRPFQIGLMSTSGRPTFRAEGDETLFETDALISVGSVVDSHTLTVPVTFGVDNSDRALRIGQFVHVAVPVVGATWGVTIAQRAVIDDNGIPVCYVQASGETFERRRLRLGVAEGSRVQVLEGLRAGEMTVVEGAFQIRLASMSDATFSGGHAH